MSGEPLEIVQIFFILEFFILNSIIHGRLSAVCGAVWQPSSLTLLILWTRISFTFLLRAFPSWCSSGSAQPSVYSVSLRSCFNSCNTSTTSSLIVRNMFFFILQNSSIFWTISSIVEISFIRVWSVPYRQFFFTSRQTFQSNRAPPLLPTFL